MKLPNRHRGIPQDAVGQGPHHRLPSWRRFRCRSTLVPVANSTDPGRACPAHLAILEQEVTTAQVVIRNIDDDVVERLKARAAEKKSLKQKLRDVLTETAKPSRAEVLTEVDLKILCKTALQFGHGNPPAS